MYKVESYRNYLDDAYLYFPDLKNDIAFAEFNAFWEIKRNKEYNKYKEAKDVIRKFYRESHKIAWINLKVFKRLLMLTLTSIVSFIAGKNYDKLKKILKGR